jgi:hypothetical protein
MQRERRLLGNTEEEPRAERARLAGEADLAAGRGIAWSEVARLVELAVVRQIDLRYHPDQPSAAEKGGAVVQQPVHRDGKADQRRDRQLAGALDEPRKRILGGVDQRLLVEEIVAGISGEPQLGKNHQRGVVRRGLLDQLEGGLGVVPRIADAHDRGRHRDAREAVAVEVEEVLHRRILAYLLYGTLSHMLRETILVGKVLLTIELEEDLRYTLRYGDLVEYSNGRRRVRGRASPYEFRSVEQLRYDFEQDVRRVEQDS